MSNGLVIGQQGSSRTRAALLVVTIALSATVLRVHAKDPTEPSTSEGHSWSLEEMLKAPNKAILYSLEPWDQAAPGESTLHGFKIIGKLILDRDLEEAVAAEFKAAIASWDGSPQAGCFDPRHALTVTSGGETYDLLLCYACGELEIFRGKSMVADMPARGTGEVLNAILSAHKVPLSRSAMKLQASPERSKLAR